MLSVKQGGIKYHFLSLWYDSTWDWTHVSQAIGEHFNPLHIKGCFKKAIQEENFSSVSKHLWWNLF